MLLSALYDPLRQPGSINVFQLHKLIGVLSIVLLSACAATRVQPDYDATIDFNKYKTYILPLHAPGQKQKDKNLFVQSTIAQEIDTELRNRNYIKLKDDGKQDFIIGYRLIVETSQASTHGSIGIGMGSYGGRTSVGVGIGIPLFSTKTYQEGNLLIEITDSKLNTVVWQATGTNSITIDADRDRTREEIRETVKKILAEFPPKQ